MGLYWGGITGEYCHMSRSRLHGQHIDRLVDSSDHRTRPIPRCRGHSLSLSAVLLWPITSDPVRTDIRRPRVRLSRSDRLGRTEDMGQGSSEGPDGGRTTGKAMTFYGGRGKPLVLGSHSPSLSNLSDDHRRKRTSVLAPRIRRIGARPNVRRNWTTQTSEHLDATRLTS